MNTKNRLIEKLLKVAKKHKVLTYPVLALVAVISVINYFFSWSTGAGKRVVAVVMVMVMLVSQSYFLTSSATELVDDENAALVQQELQEEVINNEPVKDTKLTTEASTTVKEDVTEGVETSTELEEEIINDNPGISDADEVTGGDSATTEITTEEETEDVSEDSVEEEQLDSKLDNEKKTIKCKFYYPGQDGPAYLGDADVTSNENISDNVSFTYNITAKCSEKLALLNDVGMEYSGYGCYQYETTWYYDSAYSTPVTNTNSASANATEETNDIIKIYAKRTLVKYRVKVKDKEDTDSGSDPVTYNTAGMTDGYFYVAATGGDDNKSGTLTISDLHRNGYTAAVPGVSEGSAVLNDAKTTATITLTGTNYDKTVTLKWTGKMYNIQYAKLDIADSAVASTQEVQYGNDSYKIAAMEGIAEPKEGWKFKCWTIGLGETATEVTPGSSVTQNQSNLYSESTTVTLYPKYEYAGITLEDGTNSKELKYEYKKKENTKLIQGKYTNSTSAGSTRFTYTITSGNEASIYATYGITVEATDNGISVSTGDVGPTSTTGETGVDVTFQIKDNMGTPSDEDDRTSSTFTITIKIDQRSVTIKAPTDGTNIKPYDKKDTSYLDKNTPLETNVTGVTVSFDGSHYENVNVGITKIILENPQLNLPADEAGKQACYNFSDTSVEGEITPRTVYLSTYAQLAAGKEYIRAGEDDPEFGVTAKRATATEGLLSGDTIETLGKITYLTNRPNDKTIPSTGDGYTISVKEIENANYKVVNNDADKGTYKVVQESANGKYDFDGFKADSENEWYYRDPKVIASSTGGYDTVHISRDGGNTFETSAAGEGIALEEADSRNSELMIKLTDSQTNAVTTTEPLTVNCDMTMPEYVGYAVDELSYNSSTGIPGFIPGIGGVFDFGTYTRATINVQIEYKDETSGLATLEYGLFGEDVTAHSVPFNQDTGIATITILNDAAKKGAITCRALDTAGNVSETIRLKPSGSGNDYEWVVEQAAPVCEPLVVYSGKNKDVIVQDQSNVPEDKMAYYNHCQALLKVTDSDSGIHDVVWHINDADSEETMDSSKKVTAQSFTKDIPSESASPYTVYATVTDNAGNTYETNKITFKIDDVDPNLVVDYDDKVWSKLTTISFTTSDDLSGVDYAKVTDGDGNTIDCDLGKPDANGVYTASFEATKKGTYSIVVADKAGNTATWTKEITMISDQTPDCPGITVSPDEPTGTNGWYTSNPVVTITNPQKTKDGTPVNTSYRIWKEGESSYNDTPITGAEKQVELTDEGIFNIKAWSKSVSGVECESYDEHIVTIQIDKTAPEISFTTEKGSGSTVLVNFTVTDSGSGVDKDAIKVLHGTQDMTAKVEQTDTGYTGSFEISETGNYSIQAADMAGNVSDAAAFTPMSMKIKAVTNISDSKATLGANIIKGTFDIASASLSYRKYVDAAYTEAEAVTTTDENGNVALSAVLENLESGTAYVFKVTAVSSADEVLEYEGYFKTLSTDVSGISVTGTTRYADDTEGSITVGLFEGNVCIMAKEVNAGEEFVFNSVPDGNYTIVATDGTYSKSMRLMIKDGLVVYPESYIELILSGKNTSVVITTDDTPNITADNMDSIFNNDTVNFTETDKTLIEAGGTVEFKLYATLMTVSSVSANEISAMYAVTDKNKVVGAYLDLSLYKIVTDTNGDTERSRVTNLASGASISVTIPLGELAGKPGLEVIRIHNDGENFIGASLADQDNNPDTYTITTNQFSTYAVLYSREEASTQPTTEPTTVPSNNNGTVTPPSVPANPSQQTTTTEDNEDNGKKIKDKDTKPAASNTSSVGTLKSSGTAKTGDAAPIAVVGFMMLLCMGGFFFLKRKLK